MRKKGILGRRILSGALAALLLCSVSPVPALAAEQGETIYGREETIEVGTGSLSGRDNNFNDGWKFYLGDNGSAQNPGFNDNDWESVTLPHDFSISQNFTTSGEAESGFLPGGTGWYRKSFVVPEGEQDKRAILNFDGAYSHAFVYVNGIQVGENRYGYSSFAFDITDALTMDGQTENLVAVKVVNEIPSSRWYSGSGIYRDVTLDLVDPVHVAKDGIYVTTPGIAGGSGTVSVGTEVENQSETPKTVSVTQVVKDKGGNDVSRKVTASLTVEAGQTEKVDQTMMVENPELWSVDAPNLYTVHTEIKESDCLLDSCNTEFGFRYFSFDGSGFHLNGENVKLNGVCLHHDQGALGSAASYDAMYRQLSIMKDMGVNAIRTSHNPADEDFIDICNELGLLVIEELFDGLVDPKNENSNDFSVYFNCTLGSGNGLCGGSPSMTWAEFAARTVVRRDRNDPAVIAWSLGNEIQEGTYWENVGSYAAIAQNLINWIKEEDTTRPATSGDNNRGGDSRLVAVLDTIRNSGGVVGFNYANSAGFLKSLAERYGGGVIIASETSSATNSRGIYSSQANNSNADGKYHLTSYDTSSVSWGITAHDSLYNTYQYDCVAGEFVWTGFDYIGEPTPWNGTKRGSVSGAGPSPNSSYFGIVETTGFEKDTYYLYRSQWNKKDTTLHLVTAWDSDNMINNGGKTPVVVYSNAPKVELYRNGTLVGTAVRQAHTSAAGHTYYTYTTESNNAGICTAVSGYGSAGLYAAFDVAYEAGTLSAKALDENGREIALSGNSGKNAVTTPGPVSKLVVSQNQSEIAADGSSLVYISVDVTDAAGNPDTTASNEISFSLSGSGEIAGVDNGDQASTEKYQQASVLTGKTTARIRAYAGKALVIVRSTKEAGSFTVTVSSGGLTGESVSVTTKEEESGPVSTGLKRYTMVRNYTVMVGTEPVLRTEASGEMADGTNLNGNIVWETIPAETYTTAGDYTIRGTLSFDGIEPISVTGRLHVIADVIALRNISTAVTPGTVPVLPDTVKGVMADGTLAGEFTAEWDAMSQEQFAAVGDVVTVKGTAVIFGERTLPVTASVRVAEAVSTESVNVAPRASGLTQDIDPSNQSDTLDSIKNGNTKPGDDTSERWSNWNNRTTSADAAITFRWDTAQALGGVNLYYYYDHCAAKPEAVKFEYSLDGGTFVEIGSTEKPVESYSLGAEYAYTFDSPVNPVALRITFTQQNGISGSNCVALTEAEIMTYAGRLEYKSSGALSGITVDGTPVADFAGEKLTYEASGSVAAAEALENAGITILPVLDHVVRILTVSEDGSDSRMYEVTLKGDDTCSHTRTEFRNVKNPTCTQEGYSGDLVCVDCEAVVQKGETVAALGHKEELLGAKTATCTEEGYTGDKVCNRCETILKAGSVIARKDHSYDTGVVTKEPTEKETGIKIYTCTVCKATKEEILPIISAEKKVPEVTVAAEAASGVRITLTGKFTGYPEAGNYYEITAHGLVYYSAARLGTRSLTVNTPGRTRINFSGYKADGSFSYTMKPSYSNTRYVVRAFLAYTDSKGRTIYRYTNPITVSYNSLQQ